MNNPIMYSDPSGHIAIGALLLGMAIGFGVGFAIAGGWISGSVTDFQSAVIAFGIGAIANVVAKGIADLINKGVTAGAQKALNSPIFDGLQLNDLIGSGLKNNGLNPLYNKILNQGAKYVVNANGLWVKSALYSFTSSSLSSLFSGWY